MKIAITGGLGSVGKAIIDMALVQGHSVVSIDRVAPGVGMSNPNVTYIQTDIVDYAAMENAFRGCDALIHMAGIPAPGQFPDHKVHNNTAVGSYNALRAAIEVGI